MYSLATCVDVRCHLWATGPLSYCLQKCLLAVSHGSGARGSLPRAPHKDLNLQAKIYIYTAINYTVITKVYKFIITGVKYYTGFNNLVRSICITDVRSIRYVSTNARKQ